MTFSGDLLSGCGARDRAARGDSSVRGGGCAAVEPKERGDGQVEVGRQDECSPRRFSPPVPG